jgi:hypothetical protein
VERKESAETLDNALPDNNIRQGETSSSVALSRQTRVLAACDALREGKDSLRQICARPDMPSMSAFMEWVGNSPELAEHYARAREEGLERMADELLAIADDASGDFAIVAGRDGAPSLVVDHENIQRSRLKVDARKWLLSKRFPKRYGELVQTRDVGGPKEIVLRVVHGD